MIKIAGTEADLHFGENNIAVTEVSGKKVCIARHNTELFAFASGCPHAGAALNDGWLDAVGNVVCPLHGYKFNMKTGRDASGDYFLKRWKVAVKEDGIYLDTSFI